VRFADNPFPIASLHGVDTGSGFQGGEHSIRVNDQYRSKCHLVICRPDCRRREMPLPIVGNCEASQVRMGTAPKVANLI
jgi:hypothetical protein